MRQDVTLHKKSFHELTTDELYELLRVRSEVFVVEQNCVYQDLDGDDQQSIHLWLNVEDKVVALARWQTNHASCHRCSRGAFRCNTYRYRGTGICQRVL